MREKPLVTVVPVRFLVFVCMSLSGKPMKKPGSGRKPHLHLDDDTIARAQAAR